jgi:tetratricopeptide (TPR) repeat protein
MSSATTTTTPGSRPLPPKENALFKRILKCYEQKLYKNGLKFAKQILGNPQTSEHAETLAMKGLILNSMGRREEGKEYVRRGLKNNLRSHTCWHVFGIIQRAERKYDEALKCYRNALRWDPTNLQIMRELSVVQIHIRDLVGYRDTRYQLFQMKPTQRASWIGLAMAYHLLKDYKTAFHILEGFRQTAKEQESCKGFDLEKSELLLYQGTIVEESGNVEGAKQFLLNNDYEIYDKYTYYETVARLCLSLEEFDQAETAYRQLIHMNQENEAYYQGLAKSLKIGDDNPKEVVRMYNSIVEEYPRALLPKRLLLYVTSGEELMTYLKPYLVKHFEKGTPSVFNDLKPSYVNPEKMESIEKLVEDMTASLEKSSRYFEGKSFFAGSWRR